MNEFDWLAATDPLAMLDHVAMTASDRKLRLFACACARRCWPLFRYPTPRHAVELAERLALGQAAPEQVEPMRQQAEMSVWTAPEFERSAYEAAAATLAEQPLEAARNACTAVCQQAVSAAANEAMSRADEVRIIAEESARENRALGRLALEIFGNPFRPTQVEPAWLAWSDGAALALARWIDEEQHHEELPYLADALTDAGCGDDVLLRHLREPGPHPLGCWALDAILARG